MQSQQILRSGMIRSILFNSCLLFSFGKMSAQTHDVDLTLSQEYEEPKNSVVFDVVGSDDDGYVFARYNRKGLFHVNISIEKYNKSLKFLSTRLYEGEVDGEDLNYSAPFYFGSDIYTICSTYSKRQKESNVYYQKIDPGTLSAKGNPALIKSIQEEENSSVSISTYEISPDKKTIAFLGLPGYFKKYMLLSGMPIQFGHNEDVTKGTAVIYDGEMQKKWEKEFTLPYKEKLYDFVDVHVDNSGNLYILGILYNEKAKEKVHGQPNYKYVITAITDNGKTITPIDVTLKDKFITDCNFFITDDNELVCSGFYSNSGTSSIKGAYYMNFDPGSKATTNVGTMAFDAEFLKLFMSDNKAEKGSELSNFSLDRIIEREDGGAVLIGEKYYVTTYTTYDAATHSSTTHTVYHYNDVIVININPDHTIKWATRIPKLQASSSGFYLSYASFIKDDMIYLIFNDNDKNLDEKNPDKIYAYDGKNSMATLATINPDGSYSKKALFSNKEEGVILRPQVSEQVSADEMVIYCEKGRKYEIGKITFR